jgi:hypothetical protein
MCDAYCESMHVTGPDNHLADPSTRSYVSSEGVESAAAGSCSRTEASGRYVRHVKHQMP